MASPLSDSWVAPQMVALLAGTTGSAYLIGASKISMPPDLHCPWKLDGRPTQKIRKR